MLEKRYTIWEALNLFRPSWKTRVYESWFKANGLTLREAMWLKIREGFEKDTFDRCYICGRTLKRPLGWVELIPTFDEGTIKYVCSDHGGEWWNCVTGTNVIFSHKPYWQRQIRNYFYIFIQYLIVPIRFVWFFLSNIYFWYVAIYFYWAWKECTVPVKDVVTKE